LLAEDHPVNQKLGRRVLEKAGAEVTVVGNGIEALEALREADFDAVLMDCQMPEMDGYEATRLLRASPGVYRNHRIPVIALTAHALAPDRKRCEAAGMDDYLTKPIDAVRLVEAINRAVGGGKPAEGPPIFSQENLLLQTDGDMEFGRELISLFVESSAESLAQMSAAVRGEDSQLVRRLAHTLRGGAGAVAAVALAETAGALERAEDADLPAAHRALQSVHHATLAVWRSGGWLGACSGAMQRLA
jgi:CheY-like chemotaxis protein